LNMNDETNAISIGKLIEEMNSGKMASDIATLKNELKLKEEIISLRKTINGLVESLIDVQEKAKADLQNEKNLSDTRYRETINRVQSVLFRDQGIREEYVLVRVKRYDGGIDYAFRFDGHEIMNWIMDWKGSTQIEDIPDELEGFKASYLQDLRDEETDSAMTKTASYWTEAVNREMICTQADEKVEMEQKEPVCMDEAGVPTTFERKCGICGEEGRNSRTHKEEPIEVNGRLTHHWI